MSDFSEASAVEAAFCHRVGLGATPSILTRSGRKELADIALAALKPFMRGGWQDIATAPKDGTAVILLDPVLGVILGAFSTCEVIKGGGVWASEEGQVIAPTHWHLLPNAPAREK